MNNTTSAQREFLKALEETPFRQFGYDGVGCFSVSRGKDKARITATFIEVRDTDDNVFYRTDSQSHVVPIWNRLCRDLQGWRVAMNDERLALFTKKLRKNAN